MARETAPVYIAKPNNSYFFTKPKLGIGFVPKGACTNNCVFCKPNIEAMEAINPNTPHITPRKYSTEEYAQRVIEELGKGKDVDEIVITGIIGEPLLYYKDLKALIRRLREISSLPIRLNTNGQASLITHKSPNEVANELSDIGLTTVTVSLNAINEADYQQLCQPKMKGAFQDTVAFVKACRNTPLHTQISFVDYSGQEKDWPAINKESVYQFAEKQLGIGKDDVIFRPYMH